MKKLLVLLVLPILFLSSCGKNKIKEGELTYDITYPYMEVTGLMSAILPKEMNIVFKGTKMKTTIARGKIFSTEVITDEADNSMEMRLDFGSQKFYCELTKEEVDGLIASAPNYTIKKTEEADSINGVWAYKNTVSSTDSLQPGDAWFTEDLEIEKGAWFSAYKDVKGMPIIYDVERYGLFMHCESTGLVKREVKDEEFDRDPSLEKIDFEEYEKQVQELFDILLD